ncbi:uncharacterized protein LOC128469432 isoform X2 [Spea bombifrons]|uniref:uncharacterized protein LOC128469432 isoform X2 n=1 Tax=Spea bombifrons TaxID=233779 RepID=UPI00234A507F|nr:uncharacterized protein LOC128469432 isoform X2 [Spea bombifrons]
MEILLGQEGLPDAISEKNSAGLFKAPFENKGESDEIADFLDADNHTVQGNQCKGVQVTEWEGADDIIGKKQQEQESSLEYPMATESHVDITAVLLPSGGIQSHPHANRKTITETQSIQHVKRDSPAELNEVKSDQSQLNLCPKINLRGKNNCTVPFNFGTQSQAPYTTDALDEKTICVTLDDNHVDIKTLSDAPPRDIPHDSIQANTESEIGLNQSTGLTKYKCEINYLVEPDNQFEETSTASDYCKLQSLTEKTETSELCFKSQNSQGSHKTEDSDPVEEESKYSTINEDMPSKQLNQDILSESTRFDKLVNEKFEEEGENSSLPIIGIDSPPATALDTSEAFQHLHTVSLDLDEDLHACLRQIDKHEPCITSVQRDTEQTQKLGSSESPIDVHSLNLTTVGNLPNVEGPELFQTTMQFNTLNQPIEAHIQEPLNPAIRKVVHTHEDPQQLIKASTQKNDHTSGELIIGKECQKQFGESIQAHTSDPITVDQMRQRHDGPENIQEPTDGQLVNQTIVYLSICLDEHEPFSPLIQKFDDTADGPIINEKWQKPSKISIEKMDHACEDLNCNMERQSILDQTARQIAVFRHDDPECQASKEIFAFDDQAVHNAPKTACHTALAGTLGGNYEVDFESSEETDISSTKNTGQQDSLSTTNTINIHGDVTSTTEEKNKAWATCDKDVFNTDQVRIDMELSEMENRSPSNEELESTKSGKESIIESEQVRVEGRSLSHMEPSAITFPPSNENTSDLSFPGTNDTHEVVVKTSVSDSYGKLIKENSDSLLHECRRIYLETDGQGFNLLDSGIVLSKKKDIEGGHAFVTLRNGKELGMKTLESNLFLYYQHGIHFYTTKELNDTWFYVKDRITREEMIMKKIPITIHWVKMLHNFLFLPYHPLNLVPYAVIYDRNGFILFLMQHRHVLVAVNVLNNWHLNL